MQAANGERQLKVLPSRKAYEPQQWTEWQDIPTSIIVALISWR